MTTDHYTETDHHTEKGTVMTTHTAHPGHRFTTKTAGIALAGAVLAVGAGYGVANYVLDETPAVQTPTSEFYDPAYNPAYDRDLGFDPNGFAGTDREELALMHRAN